MTDASLIPIYAFPEAGIELKSVLWRRKASDVHTPGAYVALPALLGDRVRHPAAMREASKAALRSLATFALGGAALDTEPNPATVLDECRQLTWARTRTQTQSWLGGGTPEWAQNRTRPGTTWAPGRRRW